MLLHKLIFYYCECLFVCYILLVLFDLFERDLFVCNVAQVLQGTNTSPSTERDAPIAKRMVKIPQVVAEIFAFTCLL